MKRFFLLIIVAFLSVSLFSQDFFRGDFSKDKKYVILVNPTAGNIGVVTFLMDNGILKTDPDWLTSSGYITPARNMTSANLLSILPPMD